jgi:hypothetical protein
MYDLMSVLVVLSALATALWAGSTGVTYGLTDVKPKLKRVYYEGSDTLGTGYALCYNQDYGTAAEADVSRAKRVEKPSTSNNMFFAGVVAPSSGGLVGPCWIDIILPGSKSVEVYAKANCTISTTQQRRITFEAGQYYFAGLGYGFPGQGSAIVKQTLDRSTAGLLLVDLQEGEQSGGIEHVTPANGAMTIMLGGVTLFPVTTIGTGDATYTLPDGIEPDQRKAFFCEGTMSSNDIVITVSTVSLIAAVATSGYDVCTMDAAGEYLSAVWNGKAWFVQGSALA